MTVENRLARSGERSSTIKIHGGRRIAYLNSRILFALSFAAWPLPFLPPSLLPGIGFLPCLVGKKRPHIVYWLTGLAIVGLVAREYYAWSTNEPFSRSKYDLGALIAFALAVLQFDFILSDIMDSKRAQFLFCFAIAWEAAVILFFKPEPGYSIWKYGAAQPVALAAAIVTHELWKKAHYRLATLIAGGAAMVMFATDIRNVGGCLILPILAMLFIRKGKAARVNYVRLGLGGIAAVLVLSILISSGAIGDSLKDRWDGQGGNPLAVLAYDRSEFGVGVALILDDPLVGRGGNGIQDRHAVDLAYSALESHPPRERGVFLKRDVLTQVSAHSAILDMWLRGGPVCALFIILSLLVCLAALRLAPSVLGLFLISSTCWDLLFSPWTYFSPPVWALSLAYLTRCTCQIPSGEDEIVSIRSTREDLRQPCRSSDGWSPRFHWMTELLSSDRVSRTE